ncbi:MAG TPA: nucleoside triphosphate pyrophosphohydrolase [Patescibacteria group bacterium]|nr:nucleoside triphosphate pyrophosphohydrolase [Patescibacteria group bacterium]
MNKKYFYNKLIRDKMPVIIETAGNTYKTKILDDKEVEKELKKKLIEEAKEVEKATKDELLSELADTLELTKSIASHFKIPFGKVEKFQEEKRKKRGGFKKKLFLIWSTGKPGA